MLQIAGSLAEEGRGAEEIKQVVCQALDNMGELYTPRESPLSPFSFVYLLLVSSIVETFI